MRNLLIIVIVVLLSPMAVGNSKESLEDRQIASTGGVSFVTGVSSALARADIALAKSLINPNHLKGEYAEIVSGEVFLKHNLRRTGNWQPVSSRFGRQGIDQIFIKYDSFGNPGDIIVNEVKYGSSNLGDTSDGRQLGKNWTEKRLLALGDRYLEAANYDDVKIAQRPSRLTIRHQLELDLGNGRKATFWRENANRPWKFEGSTDDLVLSRKRSRLIGTYLKRTGRGEVDVQRKLIQVQSDGRHLNIGVMDAKLIDAGVTPENWHPTSLRVPLAESLGRLSQKELSTEVARQLKSKLPHLGDQDAIWYARKIVKEVPLVEGFRPLQHSHSMVRSSLLAGAAGALFVVAIDGVFQLVRGEANYRRLLESGALGFGSVAIGSASSGWITSSFIRSEFAHSAASNAASGLGVSTPILTKSVGIASGVALSAVIYASVGYLMGHHDEATMMMLAVSELAGFGAGASAATGTLALVSAYATAGTGTAISGLSGVAATNASLAWLGGGATAVGGLGTGGGALLVGGIAAIAAIAVAAGVIYVFIYLDERAEQETMRLLLIEYQRGDVFKHEAERMFPLSLVQ